ncbi:hypothetical protein BRADI_5g08805v3 [Brachypodium distachyon]|uniref:Uncharacterized protein n=1 Tax=Brachypodium distachyon TaxID=15368 RepID=A0A2K2CG25_BRADI|nr:hypothetical protein BRADI_5g08805v3 [Brachypodium distachyon]
MSDNDTSQILPNTGAYKNNLHLIKLKNNHDRWYLFDNSRCICDIPGQRRRKTELGGHHEPNTIPLINPPRNPREPELSMLHRNSHKAQAHLQYITHTEQV